MGQRISFELIENGSTLEYLIRTNYGHFRNWLIQNNKESIKEYNESISTKALIDFLDTNTALSNSLFSNQELLDDLTSQITGRYLDFGRSDDLTLFLDPCMNKWRYEESTELVREKADKQVVQLWNYLIDGRSLINNKPFIKGYFDVKIAYWTTLERQFLQEMLVSTFGTSIELQLASKKSSSADRQFFGLECVLQMLESVENKEGDIIISIE